MTAHLVCDIETTGTEPGCCILSIALVPVGIPEIEPFYETISHEDSLIQGFHDELETLSWWDKQKTEAQTEAFSGTRKLRSVLESVSFYMDVVKELGSGGNQKLYLWGNGKDFDNVLLSAAYKRLGLKQPWDFRNNRCYRDLASYYPWIAKVKPEIPHHALYDAKAEAAHLEMIFNELRQDILPLIPGVSDG